jgi:inorganic pyrophosphatase
MSEQNLPTGKNVPVDVYALIEIPKGGGHIKYEFNHKIEHMVVDRLRDSAMIYPANYGSIPQTLSEDGDPLDILVICEHPVQTGVIISARPIGVLVMEDENGMDEKIIAVPADSMTSAYMHIQNLSDIGEHEKQKIEHFFKHYKDLEGKNKWTKISKWGDVKVAQQCILESIEREKQHKKLANPPKKHARPCLPFAGRLWRKP